jgi:hypothetical protein
VTVRELKEVLNLYEDDDLVLMSNLERNTFLPTSSTGSRRYKQYGTHNIQVFPLDQDVSLPKAVVLWPGG